MEWIKKVIPVVVVVVVIITIIIIRETGTVSLSFRKYLSNIPESMKSRNYRKHPYWAQHTYFRKH